MTTKDEVMALHRSLLAQVDNLEEQILAVRVQVDMVAMEMLSLCIGDIVEVYECWSAGNMYRMKITGFELSHNMKTVSTVIGDLVETNGEVGTRTKRIWPDDRMYGGNPAYKITKIEWPEKAEAESDDEG